MDPTHPRADGPGRRRAFTASDKLAYLAAYAQASEHGEGGAYLRREGLYSSLISEWRKQRDAASWRTVGVRVHTHESGVLAKELMEQVFKVHGVPQVLTVRMLVGALPLGSVGAYTSTISGLSTRSAMRPLASRKMLMSHEYDRSAL